MKKILLLASFCALALVAGFCFVLLSVPRYADLPPDNANFVDKEWAANFAQSPDTPAPEGLFDVAFNQMRRGEVKGVDLMYTLAHHKTAKACGMLGYIHYFGSAPHFWQNEDMPHIKELRRTFLAAGGKINHKEALYWLSCNIEHSEDMAWYGRFILALDSL